MKTTDQLTFASRITRKYRRLAEEFSRQQANPEKAKQVYRNTLAVCVVNFYCQCMDIETDLEGSDSWDGVMRSLADVADLKLKSSGKDLGKIECRPVSASSDAVEVPPDVWLGRIGYIAVQLDEAANEAKLVGFAPKIKAETLPLKQWRGLEEFLDRVHRLKQTQSQSENMVTKLSEWLQGAIEPGWDSLQPAFRNPSAAIAVKNSGQKLGLPYNSQPSALERRKQIDLERAGEQVSLVVGLQRAKDPEMDISVQVYPAGGQTYLPQNLQLIVLDEDGQAVMQAYARSTENIQFEFSGEFGERFSVKLALGDFSITEPFLI